MPKDNKPDKGKPEIKPEPSKPIDKKEKDKKAKDTGDKTATLDPIQPQMSVNVPITGSITAGKWVAEIDMSNIRKNTLRLGE